MQKCAHQCGATAEQLPIVGVGRGEIDGKPVGHWRAYPICDACWRDPQHRVKKLKVHYFHADQAPLAVSMAGSANVVA